MAGQPHRTPQMQGHQPCLEALRLPQQLQQLRQLLQLPRRTPDIPRNHQ
jgi:hypothetical protein